MKKGYGLALGGGAARGICHIGVIQFLEENDVNITEISGTSMGAVVGACLAFGMNSKDMEKLLDEINFLKFAIPDGKKGLISGKKIYEELERIFGDKKIEDAKIPLKIVATNFNSGTKHIFKDGSLVEAIRASISIPGIFEPYKIGEHHFIDGMITENLPVNVLESTDIIAVSALRTINIDIDEKKEFLGIDYTNYFKKNYRILQRTMDIFISQNEEKSMTNPNKNVLLIKPKFAGIDYREFYKYGEITKVGYNEAKLVFQNI